ncbi:Ca2+/H+ antiporter [Myroides gitamensis]|nr:Ca2+/H+ antiporter [Myroides gitamensis]
MTTKKVLLSEIFPTKTRIRLVAVWLIVILFLLFGQSFLGDSITGMIALGTFLVLLFTIIGAAFGVVKEADELAHKLGEPYGTLILTLSIVSIEVILIAAVMLGPGENPTIGERLYFFRDDDYYELGYWTVYPFRRFKVW